MKALVTEAPIQQTSKYPCIMKYMGITGQEFFVLFHAEQCGIVIASENSDRPIGYYGNNTWLMNYFTPVTPGTEIKIVV